MKFCSNTNNALFFASVDEISDTVWQNLNCENTIYFHRNFLKSIEKSHPEIQFAYIILKDKKEQPIALATIQVVDFFIEGIRNDLERFVKKIKNIGRNLYLIQHKKPLQLLICGNAFVSGEHGVFIEENQDKKKVLKALAKAILHYTNSTNALNVDVLLLKDFKKESLFITDTLKELKYHPFSVEPNMVLQISKNWQNFDDYLAAMKTKFRVKAKKALSLSSALRIETETSETIENVLPEMKLLYQKVADKAAFNLSDFNLDAYKNLKEKLGEKYILKTYWLADKMVGFISGIVNENSLDAHFVGIDYELNRTYAIYQRMLYDYVEMAIDKKMKTLNFGRTASEIKSSVGAVPEDLTIYLRHKKRITNKILKLFLQRVAPTPFQQKFPFKKLETLHEK